MTIFNLKSLIGRLNDTCRKALEEAAGLCQSKTHYEVEIEHLLVKLLEPPNTDLDRILRQFNVNRSHLTRDLNRSLDRFKTGTSRNPLLSPHIPLLVQDAWLLASVDFGATHIRSGHILLALLNNPELARLARGISSEFQRLTAQALHACLLEVSAHSVEDTQDQADVPPDESTERVVAGKTTALDQYTVDLTAKARNGEIDPVLGRDFEIRQVIDILTRRRQNNPILTGEAGVGKTAVVEGFALRVVAGDVPKSLKNIAVRTLDLGLLQAGAGVRGEFENRLKSVITEVKSSLQPIILFIDEAHTMIGAGGQAGQSDAANLLKPALARGELRTIAATTWSEYKKYFEKDAALARRFQVIKVEEPTIDQAIVMMRGLTEALEKHHQVRILDEAVVSGVKLSHRYLSGRQLPDKSVSVLDTACARVTIGLAATPPAIEDVERRISQLTTERTTLEREQLTGSDFSKRITEVSELLAVEHQKLESLKHQFAQEKTLVAHIRKVRAELETLAHPNQVKNEGSLEDLRTTLIQLNADLAEIQGETPLLQPWVTADTIAAVISGWTGIPIGKMFTDEIQTVLKLKDRLEQRVVGQSAALESISQRIRTSRANLTDPRRPVGVFLLVGTSGVGKTETALALAETLYGGERNLISINMSEYQEAHTVSSLKGSPPGYVGYGEGGVLTEAVRRKPYSVVLLDEVEKAHPDVMELFYQVFDKGVLEDGEGREIDFKNTIILLTSNVASELILSVCSDPETRPDPPALVELIRPELTKVFKPALLGRMVVVPYYPISDEIMRQIIDLQLDRIRRRLAENHNASFSYDPSIIEEIASRCREVATGARNVDHLLTGTVLPELANEFLSRMATNQPVTQVHIGCQDGKFHYQIW